MGRFREEIRLPVFERDLKRLLKRYRSLEEDLRTFIAKELFLVHVLGKDTGGIARIPGLTADYPPVFKARRFACRALRGTGSRSGIRVIYAFEEGLARITLIEIYYKGDQEVENRDRINKWLLAAGR
jgi:mRNA-degrading endonuclease RelE of RelBE toxin-antitoxin system